MSAPTNNPYPNALKVVQQISNLTEGQDCIFRGEPEIYKYPCSSTLYRQLKKENATKGSIPGLLRKRQNNLIERIKRHKDQGDNDLDRLMAYQHNGGKTNLLDFTGNKLVALFFACFGNDDKNGQIIVKRRSAFTKVTDKLHESEVVLLEPPKDLPRAKDQSGVLLHTPTGFLSFEAGESVVIKAEWRQEVLEHLKNEYDISYETLFDDMQGMIQQERREDERRTSGTIPAATNLQGFARPENSQNIFTMGHYVRLLKDLGEGIYNELINNHADVLIAGFTEVLKHNPRQADAYYNRALVHQSKPNPDHNQAILDYNRVLELKPDYVEAYLNRGFAYTKSHQPDYEQAISDYTHTLRLNPSLVEAYIGRGLAYAEKPQPDHNQAVSDYTHALKLRPNSVEAYVNRGNAHLEKPAPDYDQAFSDYEDALKLSPDCMAAYVNRAAAEMRKPEPDYDKVILDNTHVLKLNPDLAVAYSNRGLAYTGKPQPDYNKAIQDYNHALRLNPNYIGAYINRGLAYAGKPDHPDYDKAIQDYNRAIKLNPDYAGAYGNRGNAYLEKPQPDYAKAIQDYTRAIELNPKEAKAYFNRGITYTKKLKPDYNRALIDCGKAIELDPDFAEAYYLRATIYAELEDCVNARSDYDVALKTDTESVEMTLSPALKKCLEAHSKGETS